MTHNTQGLNNTNTVELGSHGPKPTAVTEGLTEASLPIWSAGGISMGLWECTEGAFTAFRDGYTEICTIIFGSVTLEAEGEGPWRFGPGDVIVMPSGWRGTWVVHEPLRKHFTIIQDAV